MAATPPVSGPAQSAKVVSYSEKNVRFTTLIVVPKQEQILEYTCGDKGLTFLTCTRPGDFSPEFSLTRFGFCAMVIRNL